ncbi:MAG: 30S ribosomal protein S6 [Alphaproteobacteria bacterium]|nr:30S ribosomal protein S6 [Alphaproteobacteria bacterium]
MAYYENIIIARQEISPAQVDALVEKFTGIVTEGGGTVTKKEYWGLRSLSYRMKKNRKAHYVLLNLDAPPAAVKELERNEGLDEDILRFITVRVEALEEGQSAMMRRDRDERSDFGGGGRGFGGPGRGGFRGGPGGGRGGFRDEGGRGRGRDGDAPAPAAPVEGETA